MNKTTCYKLGYTNVKILGNDNALHNVDYNCVITLNVNVRCIACYKIGFSEGYFDGFTSSKKDENTNMNYWQEYENTKYLLKLVHSDECTIMHVNKIDSQLYNNNSDDAEYSTEWNESGYYD